VVRRRATRSMLVLAAITAALSLAGAALSEGWSMELTSADFKADGAIPSQFTCQGRNTSPQLAWSGPPAGAKSFLLTMIDPDSPGGDFVHWLVYDIPATAGSIPQGGPLPPGAKELGNDFGRPGYGGPCPKAGPPEHRYVFTVYALDTASLGKVGRQDLMAKIKAHSLASARLVGRYRLH
jgi:Raf kinase inhibitor-like YbhB/YbcL family protein